MANADEKIKRAFKDRLPLLQAVAHEFDPNGVFMNAFFKKLLSP